MLEPELTHVATMTAVLGERLPVGAGPLGNRMVAEVDRIVIDGERLNGTLAGTSAADWLTINPAGTHGTLDVRFTIRTDTDDLIYVEYLGKVELGGSRRAIAAPTMQTGSEAYDWVNNTQFLGVGELTAEGITYELYAVGAK